MVHVGPLSCFIIVVIILFPFSPFFLCSQGNHPRGVECLGMQVPPLEPELGSNPWTENEGPLQMEIRVLLHQEWELGGSDSIL